MTAPASTDGFSTPLGKLPVPALAPLDPAKLVVNVNPSPPPPPPTETLVFGHAFAPHMLRASFSPVTGWSSPEIGPYAPISLDPSAAVFHYAPSCFEGMKAFISEKTGKPVLWRPRDNMARLRRSAERAALPTFDEEALLGLIKTLVTLDAAWIPTAPGTSLYIRPVIIGIRPSLGVRQSPEALLYVIASPAGPYFPKPVSLLADPNYVRSWPGGTGGHKLSLNYASTFTPLISAEERGYNQNLWLFGEDRQITEVGQANFFALIRDKDGSLELITPPLNGLVLPGITRSTVLSLAANHPIKPRVRERNITMSELYNLSTEGRVVELFGSGTAVLIIPIEKIGWEEDGQPVRFVTVVGEQGDVALGEWLRSEMEGRMRGAKKLEHGQEGWLVDCA